MRRGRLIALEGADQDLLSACADALSRRLGADGLPPERTREPTNGPAGMLVSLHRRGRLRLPPQALALLWVADRLDHLEREGGIDARLSAGHDVICINYSLHSYVSLCEDLDLEWLRAIDTPCRLPDLTLLLDAGSAQVRDRYLWVAEKLGMEAGPVVVLRGTLAQIERECLRLVEGWSGEGVDGRRRAAGGDGALNPMRPNPGPGRLVAIEGLDGAGTTTQVRLLARRLGAHVAHVTHEPTDGPVGLHIRMVLEHRLRVSAATLAALFAADRMDHLYCADGILSLLRQGREVITDRYYLSSLAYQGRELDWEWLWRMHAHCIRPDVTFFIDVPVEVCLERIARGRGGRFDLFENKAALTGVRQGYLQAIERLRRAGDRIVVVDGNAPPEQVHAVLWDELG